MAMEDTVRDTLTQECVQAVFEGFEVMSIVEQQAFLSELPQEETVTAKLFYTVWINTKS
ncbi:hypothetical protein [Sphingobacterium suaedae]|uniref:Uncharacterized protein n=1 Tax=Sphingobacterium suaedae TaxID=1686402 RepID=A0ABW5KFD6_9SPHI